MQTDARQPGCCSHSQADLSRVMIIWKNTEEVTQEVDIKEFLQMKCYLKDLILAIHEKKL